MASRDGRWGSRLVRALRGEGWKGADDCARDPGLRVAIVSNDSELCGAVKEILQVEPVDCCRESEISALLEAARSWSSGLIFVDWRLGDGGVSDFVRFLKGSSDHSQIRVVAMVSEDQHDVFADVVDIGCDDFIRIPLNQECAFARLRLLLLRAGGDEAKRDSLTRLSNRVVLENRIKHAISIGTRNHGASFAVLFLGLDRFRNVNESLGHHAGDLLLRHFAERLDDGKRPGDLVVRFEGDEFVILVEGIEETKDATAVAQAVRESLQKPFDVLGQEIFLTVSIGVVMWEPLYDSPEAMLRDADIAMDRAKNQGKDGFAVFQDGMGVKATAKLKLENDLRRALVGEEFQPYYQPIVSIADGRLVGFEVLARWMHPERGMLPPSEFIDVGEEMGAIIQMDRMLIEKACRQLKVWQSRYRRLGDLTVSLNISTTQFMQHDLVSQIDLILRNTGLYGTSLKLEVTESSLMVDALFATQMLEQLRKLSIGISIDDFGTGYSSLAYLKRFEVDTLKIDCSFVFKMLDDEESMEIVRSVATLAKNLGKDTVAEGVETKSQLEALRDLGVDYAQGYHIAPPLAPEDVEVFLRRVGGVENHLEKILYDRLHRNDEQPA